MNPDKLLYFKLSAATLSSCKTLIWPTPFLFLISYWQASAHLLNTTETGLLIICSMAAAIQYYFYWRIVLDEKLLNLLQSEADLTQLDQVLDSLFNRKARQETRPLALRMAGIKKIIRYYLLITFSLWLGWIILLINHK